MPPDTIVRKSKTEGNGLFAGRDFKRGEVILKWDVSHTLTPEQVKKLSKKEKGCVNYVEGKCVMLQPPARYINHSCEANTCARGICDVAKRDIRKGEEITADYDKEAGPDLDMECRCGSKNCRGIIRSGGT